MQEVKFLVEGVDYLLVFTSSITPDEYRTTLLKGDTVLNFDVSEHQYQTPWLAVDRLLGDLITISRYTRGEGSKEMYNRIEELKTVLDGLDDAGVRHQVVKIKEYEDE